MDFQTLKDLWTLYHKDAGRKGDDANGELKRLLPYDVFLQCDNALAEKGLDGVDPYLRAFLDRPESAAPIPTAEPAAPKELDAAVPGGYPAVLPWPPPEKWLEKMRRFGQFSCYGIDFRCKPHNLRGQGRKRGPLNEDRHFKPGGRFIWRFRMTDDSGKRVDVPPKVCAIARTLAERCHKAGEVGGTKKKLVVS